MTDQPVTRAEFDRQNKALRHLHSALVYMKVDSSFEPTVEEVHDHLNLAEEMIIGLQYPPGPHRHAAAPDGDIPRTRIEQDLMLLGNALKDLRGVPPDAGNGAAVRALREVESDICELCGTSVNSSRATAHYEDLAIVRRAIARLEAEGRQS